MAIKFIVDSAADFSIEEAEKLGLYFAPLTIIFGEKEFRDRIDITPDKFYDKLVNGPDFPTTSQVTPHQYAEIYEEIIKNGDTPFVIALSSPISGTYQSAVIASQGFDEKIYILDSLNASMGERIIVEYALELANKGMAAEDIFNELEEKKKKVGIYYLVNTLDYLHKGGRLPKSAAIVGNIISLKPLISLNEEGNVYVKGKSRGTKNAVKLLIDTVKNENPDTSMPHRLASSGSESNLLKQFEPAYKEIFSEEDIDLKIIGSTIGTHIGPGSIGIAFFRK